MNVSFNFRIPWLLVPLVISALLSYKCIQPGHNWGGDFALYIEQSEAIIQGELCELYELNKCSMDYSQYAVGPYLYPPVFPAMLIPIELWAGRNLMAMKWLCACCFLLGLFICWKLFLNNKTSPAAAGILLSMMAFHSAWVTFTDQVLSDLPFLLFTMLAFYMAERTKNWIGHLLTGIVVLLAMFTRDAGIALIPSLFVFQWIKHRQAEAKGKSYSFAIVWIVVIIGYILLHELLPDGGANHRQKLLDRISWNVVATNLQDNFNMLKEYFTIHEIGMTVVLALWLIGCCAYRKSHLHWIVFSATYLTIILIWPHFQGIRFLFPVIPFMLWFVLKGLEFILERAHVQQNFSVVCLSLWMIWTISNDLPRTSKHWSQGSNECLTDEVQKCYDWIKTQSSSAVIVGCNKPTVVRLFSGNNCILSDEDYFPKSKADILFLPKYLAPQWKNAKVLFDSGNYVIIGR